MSSGAADKNETHVVLIFSGKRFTGVHLQRKIFKRRKLEKYYF
jgi:hypothetical protein